MHIYADRRNVFFMCLQCRLKVIASENVDIYRQQLLFWRILVAVYKFTLLIFFENVLFNFASVFVIKSTFKMLLKHWYTVA